MQSAVRHHTVTTIDELCSALETFQRPLTAPELLEFTSRLQLPPDHWQEHLRFNPYRYCFQTIYDSPHFEINLIGWRSGQYSFVHDHRSTACCVLILDGTLTNRDYCTVAGSTVSETARLELGPGEILSRSGWEIHRCGNEQPCGVDLATLHLYSPPLRPLSERQFR